MSDHRQMSELAARARGIELDSTIPDEIWHPLFYDETLDRWMAWNPREQSDQCADMCAALGTDTKWGASIVACGSDNVLRWLAEPCAKLEYRPAAWRLAALRVAAEIGKGMRG